MKKLLALAVAAFLATGACQASKVHFSGDTMIVVDGDDTTSITGAQARQKLAKVLDDTVVGKRSEQALTADDDDDKVTLDGAEYRILKRQADINEANRDREQMRCVIGVVLILSLLVLAIGISCIVAAYKNRRNRYHMIEKAIENNYQLPDREVVNVMYQQPVNVTARQTLHGMPAQNLGFNGINWNLFYRSFVIIIVGFALVLFFALAGAEQMAALASIVLFVGLGKAFIIYQNQRGRIAGGRMQAPQQQDAPSTPQAGNAQQDGQQPHQQNQ